MRNSDGHDSDITTITLVEQKRNLSAALSAERKIGLEKDHLIESLRKANNERDMIISFLNRSIETVCI